MFCFCEWCFYRISVSKRENSCSNPVGLLGVWVMMPWSSLWKPFSPCPWGVVSILLHLFHGCYWIWAPCFYSALTQGTPGFIPLADRTNIKGDTEEHLKEGWEVERGMTFPSKHMLGRWGREGLQPCWKEEMCVYFWCKCHTPCSGKAADSFLGEERACLFSGIEFPAAALKGRQVSCRTVSPMKPGILLEKRCSMSLWNLGHVQSFCPHVTVLPFRRQDKFCNGDWSVQTYWHENSFGTLSERLRPRNGACSKGTTRSYF